MNCIRLYELIIHYIIKSVSEMPDVSYFYRYINEMIDISYFFAGIFVWVLVKLQFIIQVITNLYLWFIIDTITHSWSGINLLFINPISFQHSLQVLKYHVMHMKWIHVYCKCFVERLFCHISSITLANGCHFYFIIIQTFCCVLQCLPLQHT